MNIAIIGAGPVGCYCGYLLAKAGHSVDIYEEHKKIGLPIQCTGLLTADFDEFKLPKESFLMNTFTQIEVNSPHQTAKIKQKEYLVNRTKFDSFLAGMAEKAGAKIHLGHSLVRKEGTSIIVKEGKSKELVLNPDKVIAADGPLSKTTKAYGFYHESRILYQGIQAVVEGKFEVHTYQTFFGQEVCPDLFAWIVPESSTLARVGLASTSKEARKMFDHFMEQNNFAVVEMQAGIIPLYHPLQRLHSENCYVLGDASGFVKATTLGGLIPGLKQAQILADCLNLGKDYEREVKALKKKMDLHLRIRKIMNKFSDKDWDRLVSIIKQPKMQKLLEEHTRENPLPIVLKALIKEPRLWLFGKLLF